MSTSHEQAAKDQPKPETLEQVRYRTSLRHQAIYLRALAASVREYSEKTTPIIVMDWLIAELEDAAAECDLEAENQEL